MAFFAFIDRDGTLIEEKNYLSDPDGVVIIPGSAQAVRTLQANGARVVVISNQAGVGRGYFGIDAVQAIHRRIQEILQKHGCDIDAFYFCPHHPNGTLPQYRADCQCRKPRPGLLLQAAREKDFPAAILRVAGIYGPDRGHLFLQYLPNEARIPGQGERCDPAPGSNNTQVLSGARERRRQ